MKLLFPSSIFMIVMLAISCEKSDTIHSTGEVVAFSSKRSSRLWIKETNTKMVVEIKTGKFKQPVGGLRMSIPLTYVQKKDNSIKVNIDESKYLEDAENWQNYSMCVSGYEYLIIK